MSGDYSGVPDSITFGANKATASFTVFAEEDDDIMERDESFVVSFTVPQGLEDILIVGDTPSTTVYIVDGDTPGMTIKPRTLDVNEGGIATYTVNLNTLPTDDDNNPITVPVVEVAIISIGTGATVNSERLTFTPENWAVPQEVTVTGVEDGSVTVVNNATGADYNDVLAIDVTVNVIDNDDDETDDDDETPSIAIMPRTLTVTEGNATGDSYTVVLDTLPTGDVTVTVAGYAGTDVTPSPATLTFTPQNWETAQRVTVTAGDDADEANDTVTLTHNATSTDTEYGGILIASVTVTVSDDDMTEGDTPAITIMPRTLTVTEEDTNGDSYTVVLASQPTGDVTVTVAGYAGTDVTPSPATLTFTPQNWETAQRVTVTAGDDADEANDTVTLTHSAASTDTEYGGILIASVTVTVSDDDMTEGDTPNVSVSRTTLTVTEEDTTGAGYTVVLDTQPTATVTVTVAGHTGTDVTPSPATLTFTPQNWETAQRVTVTAGDDADEANDMVTLTHSAMSTDADYHDIMIASVRVTVSDNDRSPTTTTGGGGGGFGPALTAPSFVDGFRTSRPLYENAQPGDAVGGPVAATHPNDDDVTYSLSGANASLFTVDEETGQIRLGQAVSLEPGQTYTVNLTATDSTGTGAIIIVDIAVGEAPYHRYDLNRNGNIEKNEVLTAVGDYFSDVIAKPLVLEVIALYFAG